MAGSESGGAAVVEENGMYISTRDMRQMKVLSVMYNVIPANTLCSNHRKYDIVHPITNLLAISKFVRLCYHVKAVSVA